MQGKSAKAIRKRASTPQYVKIAYGLDNIKAKLKETSESWIACIALVLNLVRITRQALVSLLYLFKGSYKIILKKYYNLKFGNLLISEIC